MHPDVDTTSCHKCINVGTRVGVLSGVRQLHHQQFDHDLTGKPLIIVNVKYGSPDCSHHRLTEEVIHHWPDVCFAVLLEAGLFFVQPASRLLLAQVHRLAVRVSFSISTSNEQSSFMTFPNQVRQKVTETARDVTHLFRSQGLSDEAATIAFYLLAAALILFAPLIVVTLVLSFSLCICAASFILVIVLASLLSIVFLWFIAFCFASICTACLCSIVLFFSVCATVALIGGTASAIAARICIRTGAARGFPFCSNLEDTVSQMPSIFRNTSIPYNTNAQDRASSVTANTEKKTPC